MATQRLADVGQVVRVAVTANTNNNTVTIVNAVSDMRIVPVQVYLATNAACTLALATNTTGLTGAVPLAANGQINTGFNPFGIVETVAGEPLGVTTNTNAQIRGVIVYYVTS